MSDPTADGKPARESSAGVVGVALGLGLILLLVLVVAVQGSGVIDARALLESSFDVGVLPFDLELIEGAEVATGEKVVVLEVPGAVELPRDPAFEDAPEIDEDDEGEPYDWTTLEEGETGTAPIQVFVIWYPARGATAAIERMFDNARWRDLRDFQAGGGRLMTDKDTLVWAGYDADFVIERQLERGGTFRDWMRVNLSLPDRVCILLARWARGKPAAKERLTELLDALPPHPTEGDERAGG